MEKASSCEVQSSGELAAKRCVPCEGGVPVIEAEQATQWVALVPKWRLDEDAKWIRRRCVFRNFVDAIRVLNRIADLAEAEQHHPDLAVTGYRNLDIALTTHAIGGLSENDFVLAAKIDAVLDEGNSASAAEKNGHDEP